MERFEIWKDKNSVVNMLKKIFGKVYERKIGDFEEVNKSKKNGMDISTEEALQKNIDFVKSLI